MLRDKEEMLQQLKGAALLELQSKGDLVRRRRVDDQEAILCKLKQVRNDSSLVKEMFTGYRVQSSVLQLCRSQNSCVLFNRVAPSFTVPIISDNALSLVHWYLAVTLCMNVRTPSCVSVHMSACEQRGTSGRVTAHTTSIMQSIISATLL